MINIDENNIFLLNPLLILLTLSSLLSLIIGTIVGLVQFRIKRLLVYSTISHIGFILMALIINNKESFESLLFYLVGYSIVNANNFLILLAFGYIAIKINKDVKDKYSPIQYINDLNGSFHINGALSICFAISLFSLAGIPPLIGFFTKQAVLMSALTGGYIALSIVAILVSVISAAYYLKIISQMFFTNSIKSYSKLNNNNNYYLSSILSFNISLLTLITTLFLIKPYLLLN
jgi:NADH-ubiquinone oxidoreductase chain 2